MPTPPRFSSTVNVPIAIPAWSLVVAIGTALFTAGTLYNQMSMLIETSKRSEDKVALIAEKQVRGLAALEVLQNGHRDHEQRLSVDEQRISALERSLFMPAPRK